MEARSLVFEVPDQIRGQGQLVRTRDGDWFDPPLLVPLNWNRAAPTPSRYAIPVEGADFDTVAWRYEKDGAVTGNATIYGRWLGDRISVDRQTRNLPSRLHRSRRTRPVRPRPEGRRSAGTRTTPTTSASSTSTTCRRPGRPP